MPYLAIGLVAVIGAACASAAEETKEFKLSDKVSLKVPAGWKQAEVTSSFRKAQFSIPAAEGDKEPAELVVFSFGGETGGVDANVQRWINQFEEKDRAVKSTTGEIAGGSYVFVDIAGTYNMPIGPPIQRQSKAVPGSRVLNVMLTANGEVYFLKLAGLDKTVAAQADALRASFGGDKAKEKPYETK
jgi:hypothetical protein